MTPPPSSGRFSFGCQGRTTWTAWPRAARPRAIGSMKVPVMSPAKRGYDVATMTTVSAITCLGGPLPPRGPPQDHAPRHVGRLEDHAARHLRLADAPFDEDDRDLADRAAAAMRFVEHLDEEGVAVRDDPVERHLGQRFAAPAAEAA